MKADPTSRQTPPYALAIATAGAVLALYAFTLGPSTWFWDTSEYITVGHILGIPHPPGNPLFVILARSWELLLSPSGLPVAARLNLFSAVMGASTAGLWFLLVHRVLRGSGENETVRRVGAVVAAILSATTYTVWSQSTVNEKVYTVSLFSIALASWLALRWRDERESGTPLDRRGRRVRSLDRYLVLIAFLVALSVGNHLMTVLAGPALVVFVWATDRGVFARWRLYVWCLAFGAIGISVQLYLPIRAELSPIINEADPTCEGLGEAAKSIASFGRQGCDQLSASLTRRQYDKPPVGTRLAPFSAQLTSYVQYFDWQWSRSIQGSDGFFAAGRLPATLLFLMLGCYGAIHHRRADRASFAYLLTLFLTFSIGLVFYLNFKYGYRQAQLMGIDPGLAEVRERDYFFLVSFSLWALWAGIGLTAAWAAFANRLRSRRPWLLTAPVLAVAFVPLLFNWSYASRRGDYFARDWAYNLLNSVEPYGVLVTNGDNDTFPLWYLQEVEGVRRDVTVAVWSYLNLEWYARQLRDLTLPCDPGSTAEADRTRIVCQRRFDAAAAAPIYASMRSELPERSALPLTDVEIHDTTRAGSFRLPEDAAFAARGVTATIPAGTVIAPADQFILRMVKDSWDERPIYFASTTDAHLTLGLAPFLARQGLAYRLLTPAEMADDRMLRMPAAEPSLPVYGAFVDVQRTHELLWNQFIHRHDPRRIWPDDATRGIPLQYAYAHASLARAREIRGEPHLVEGEMRIAQSWQELALR